MSEKQQIPRTEAQGPDRPKKLRRITYISSFADGLTMRDIENIGEVSARNNARDGLTGSLITLREIFYQILEGEGESLASCLARINSDRRHHSLFFLKLEDIAERSYPDWSMKTVILDQNTDKMMQPLKNVLDSLQHTHRVLEKYAPETVVRGLQAGENPLEWDFRSVEKIVLFSDIVSSTTFTESLPLSDVTNVLEAYYEIFNDAIHKAGGTISKLTGDGLMAYFDGHRGEAAIAAAVQAQEKLALYRSKGPHSWSSLLYAGIGLCSGRVVTGNIGSIVKRDYTVLGDPVNTAARLESITRKVGYSIIFDESVKNRLPSSEDFPKIGVYRPRGKESSIRIFTVDPALSKFNRDLTEIAPAIRRLVKAKAG